jgi:hypothetical protein
MRNEERSTGDGGGGRLIKQHSYENETFLINAEEIEFFYLF